MKVHSFDVFDTVVTRIVAHPSDVFRLAERSIRNSADLPERVKRLLSSARIWAEFKARRRAACEDVSLTRIYEVLQEIFPLTSGQTRFLLERELEIERMVSAPIAPTVAAIRELRRQGNRLLFVSDMYLPTEFVRELLIATGAAEPHDPVYVSGDLGVTKGSGRLFDLVLAREGIAPRDLVHYGDNPHADVAVPGRLGIAVGAAVAPLRRPRWFSMAGYGTRVLRSRLKMGLSRGA